MERINSPVIETSRLRLRPFTLDDVPALLAIHRSEEVNKYVPWWPVTTLEEAVAFYEERYAPVYEKKRGYYYAICLKDLDEPIGYINIQLDDSHDLEYGLLKKYWNQGIVTEACVALVKRVKADGMPYITATHDRNNPASGRVMQKLGMTYVYSYVEQWQPKDVVVIFRMYQLNLNGRHEPYMTYWNNSEVRYVEDSPQLTGDGE